MSQGCCALAVPNLKSRAQEIVGTPKTTVLLDIIVQKRVVGKMPCSNFGNPYHISNLDSHSITAFFALHMPVYV
jgi:hypothetical protein